MAGALKRGVSSSPPRPERPGPACGAPRPAPPPSGRRAGDAQGTHPGRTMDRGAGVEQGARRGGGALPPRAPAHGGSALCSDPLLFASSPNAASCPSASSLPWVPAGLGMSPPPLNCASHSATLLTFAPPPTADSPLCACAPAPPAGVPCLHRRLPVLTARGVLPPSVTWATPLYLHS